MLSLVGRRASQHRNCLRPSISAVQTCLDANRTSDGALLPLGAAGLSLAATASHTASGEAWVEASVLPRTASDALSVCTDNLAEAACSSVSGSASVVAASALEPLSAFLNPITLGTQAWELVHATTGLPWWASIPLTTACVRAALLPLTIKAKGATVNFSLAQVSVQQSGALLESLEGEAGGRRTLGERLRLARTYFRFLRLKHRTPSTGWYIANAFVQVNVFVALSAALRQMCFVLWPGLNSEGVLYFMDLTQPAVLLPGFATPYGPAGIFMPLALFALYFKSVGFAAASASVGMRRALELMSLPLYLAAHVMPQATLLYWLTNSTCHLGLQRVLARPRVASAVGLPMLLVHPTSDLDARDKEAIQAEQLMETLEASADPQFLRFLASDCVQHKRPQLALQCLRRLTELPEASSGDWAAQAQLAAELEGPDAAAAAYEHAAEACEPGSEQQGRAYWQAGLALLQAAPSARTAGGAGAADEQPTSSQGPDQDQVHAKAAVAHLVKASQQCPGQPEVLYALAVAQGTAGQLPAALLSVTRALDQLHEAPSGGDSEGSSFQQAPTSSGRGELAGKLAPVLVGLAARLHKSGDSRLALQAAGRAVPLLRDLAGVRQLAGSLAETLTSLQQQAQDRHMQGEENQAAATLRQLQQVM